MDDGLRRSLPVYALLTALTLAAYGPIWRCGFIDFDDPLYVSENREVLAGLAPASVAWAFTTTTSANWHPLTWISLMVDATFGGDNPRIYHATNLLFHLANTLLLFFVLRRMTGCHLRSAFVAALFAVHPLHVESVAWISERKDVLSTFFWFLTLAAYARYVERRGPMRYLAVAASLTLGLMAKPMLVSLPLVLLLLDAWPLSRFGKERGRDLIVEKLPLTGLAIVSAAITLLVQRPAMTALEGIPFRARAANAILSCAVYAGTAIWPSRLAVFYPFPREPIPIAPTVAAALVLAAVTVAALMAARSRPWLSAGWLWYLVTLVPVLGLVQVGSQARADRYTYVPLVGLFVMAAWSVPEPTRRSFRALALAAGTIALLALSACTFVQVGYWRSNLELFTHAAGATRDNAFAQFKIAEARDARGEVEAAAGHLREALRIQPGYAKARFNLTSLLARQGKVDEVAASCREEEARWPHDENTLIDLGVLAFLEGKYDDAEARFTETLRLFPDSVAARHNLDVIRAQKAQR